MPAAKYLLTDNTHPVKRLVYAVCLYWQAVLAFVETPNKQSYCARLSPALFSTNTYCPLLIAAYLLLPNLVEGQCNELICNQNVVVKLDADCEAEANPYFMLANYWSCTGPATMEYFDANGSPIPGNELNGSHIGQTITVHVTHNWSGNDCWGSVIVLDKKKPKIEIDHVTLNCTEDTSVPAVGEPTVTDNCSNNITVSHQDSIIDFGCGYTGFAGYFDPSNWAECLINNGDGGVDVTGAPDSILVEGASNSPQSTSPKYVTKYKIVIPTEGFVSFDWSSFGGSTFDPEGFYLTINNWCIQLTTDSVQSGSYTTGLLYPGDVLSFEQVSEGDADAVHTFVSNFQFHTLAWKVVHRVWTATDEYGNTRHYTQVITQTRAQLSEVIFPPDRDGIVAPMLTCGAMADLSQTGQPFIDEDGDPNTTSDQYALDDGECAFNVTYSDQVIATCEGSELVLRKWTVVDDCSSEILEHTQIIKLFDTTPPTIICPPPQAVSTDNFGCFGNVNLPQADATDDCSSAISITPNWAFGSGYGPFGNIVPGTYTVTYEATDDCGNTSSCTTSVTVEDEIGPTVICDGQTTVALDSDGNAMVHANVVDDGSYDWCCIESFEIKKEGDPDTEYAPILPVGCGDVGDAIMVTLRVTDCNGNFNTCNVDVIVQDTEEPVILAPADLTIDCTADLSDLSVYGVPTVFDNCSYALEATYEENFTGCGEGAIIRSWTATDPSGNATSAEQTLNLANLSPWNTNGGQIAWPPDYVTDGCNLNLEPFNLPGPYDGPILVGQNGCESVSVNNTDDYFWIAEPSCYKIFRNWKVIDWCQYEPNSGSTDGIWEYLQIIEVYDLDAPQFVNPPGNISVEVNGQNGNCSGEVVLPLPQVDDCSDHITITAAGDLGNGFYFQNVPVGTYEMTYTANDGCGNSANHSITISVGDDLPPTALCLNGLTVQLDANGEAMVLATTFDNGSYDNCSPDLVFSFSPNPADGTNIFTCDDVGQNLVQVYVFDDGQNMASCQSFLMVVDNPTACVAPSIVIAGLVQNQNGEMVEGTELILEGTQAPISVTASSGEFTFEDLPSGNNYELTASKSINYLNGVSAFDLAKISEHILGLNVFQETWQYIAADANGSQSITVSDMVAIQNLILQNITTYPNGTPSWQFVPDGHTFADPYHPWPFPAYISMNNLTGDYLTADFLGIKVGDVSGNANAADFGNGAETEGRNGGLFLLKTADREVLEGEIIEVSFEMPEALAWQFTLEFDPSKMAFLDVVDGGAVFGLSEQTDGKLTAVWYGKGQRGFTLSFLAKRPFRLSEILSVTSAKTPAVAWGLDETAMDVAIEFLSQDIENQSLQLFPNRPNPFSNQTTIAFYLPENSKVSFRFFDTSGRLLKTKEGYFEMGFQELRIRKEELQVSGLVFYEIQTEAGLKVGKMIVH